MFINVCSNRKLFLLEGLDFRTCIIVTILI